MPSLFYAFKPLLVSSLLCHAFITPVFAKTNKLPGESQPPLMKPSDISSLKVHDEILPVTEEESEIRFKVIQYRGQPLPETLEKRLNNINNENTALLLAYIKQHGWPQEKVVGKKSVDRALFIARNSNKAVQQNLLPLLHEAFKKHELSGQKLAEFTDVVLIGLKKKQRYGTQVAIVNREVVFNEIENIAKVDERRSSMGLMPLDDYKRLLRKMYKLD
jgi:hypothetical protein